MKTYDDIPGLLDIQRYSTKTLKRWMVLDGALLPELERQIYIASNKNGYPIEFSVLFRGMRWDSISQVGPYLVEYDARLADWVQLTSPYHYGVIFDSSFPLADIEAHWRILITCEQFGLEGFLNRLYDAVVMRNLLESTTNERQEEWLGPMECLWLPDIIHQYYHQISVVNPGSSPLTKLEKAQFTDEEWQGLSDSAIEYTAYRVILHITNFFPALLKETISETYSFVLSCFEELKQLGTLSEQAALYYMNILGRVGPVLDDSTKHSDIKTCLIDNTKPLLARFKQANSLSLATTA